MDAPSERLKVVVLKLGQELMLATATSEYHYEKLLNSVLTITPHRIPRLVDLKDGAGCKMERLLVGLSQVPMKAWNWTAISVALESVTRLDSQLVSLSDMLTLSAAL
mmetsp:Transcript_43677/g.64847  ORF Transcript_43677/g.64847 Transcript_43677/m.64847 type:complete len:107 (+) Transcript_43677:231-551(+)